MKMNGLLVGYIMALDQLQHYSIYHEESLHEKLDRTVKEVVVAYFNITAGIRLE